MKQNTHVKSLLINGDERNHSHCSMTVAVCNGFEEGLSILSD